MESGRRWSAFRLGCEPVMVKSGGCTHNPFSEFVQTSYGNISKRRTSSWMASEPIRFRYRSGGHIKATVRGPSCNIYFQTRSDGH